MTFLKWQETDSISTLQLASLPTFKMYKNPITKILFIVGLGYHISFYCGKCPVNVTQCGKNSLIAYLKVLQNIGFKY